MSEQMASDQPDQTLVEAVQPSPEDTKITSELQGMFSAWEALKKLEPEARKRVGAWLAAVL